LEVIAFFDTVDANEFNVLRQDLLLAFMEIVENSGTQLALPASRVELASADHTALHRSEHSEHSATSETTGVVSAPGSLRRQ
jgi:hypothetical protein